MQESTLQVIEESPFPRFIYSSSPDRGLDTLLKMFPSIRKVFPDATLWNFYGFENWDKTLMQTGDEQQKKWRDQIMADMSQSGVHHVGRVDQATLAKVWNHVDIWFYPTNFWETYCITALEAMLSRTAIVATDLAGLQTTVADRGLLIPGVGEYPAYSEEWQERALTELCALLRDDKRREAMLDKAQIWAREQTWENRAKEWFNIFGLTPQI